MRLINIFKQFDRFVSEDKITENQVILIQDLKDKHRSARSSSSSKSGQVNIVNEYCQILDDAARSVEEYVNTYKNLKLLKEGQQYQMMNEDSVQRLEVVQEQPSRIQDSSVWSQNQSQVFSQININTSFQSGKEVNESIIINEGKVNPTSKSNKENIIAPQKSKEKPIVNKVNRSISMNQPPSQFKNYNSVIDQKSNDKSKSPNQRFAISQQTSQAKMQTKSDVPKLKTQEKEKSNQKYFSKQSEQEVLIRRMENLTNDKIKLRKMIEEHRKIIAQLHSEESQLMWKIEREAKQILKARQKSRDYDDYERYRTQMSVKEKDRKSQKQSRDLTKTQPFIQNTNVDTPEDSLLANLRWELTRSQIEILEKQRSVNTIKSLYDRPKSQNQSYTN